MNTAKDLNGGAQDVFAKAYIYSGHGNKEHKAPVMIRRVWEKSNTILIDAFFYDLKTSKVIDQTLIAKIENIETKKIYLNIKDFIKDHQYKNNPNHIDKKILLNEVKPDEDDLFKSFNIELKIMMFIANCDGNFDKYELREVLEYIKRHARKLEELSDQKFLDKLCDYKPTEEDFYEGLDQVGKLSRQRVDGFSKSLLKLLMTDGFMHKKEKEYLAEYIQTLRELNIYVKFGFN